MLAKLSKVNSDGLIETSKKFNLPYLTLGYKRRINYRDGKTINGKLLKYERYLLELGDFKYWVHNNGSIIKINETNPAYVKLFKNNCEIYNKIMNCKVVYINNQKIKDFRTEILINEFSLFDYLDNLADIEIEIYNETTKIIHLKTIKQ